MNFSQLRAHFKITVWASVFATVAQIAPAQADETKVVVTIKPIHALVTEVMAGVGTPTLIVDGSASPHTFTLKPSSAKAINEAHIFIRVSEGLEPFTRKVVTALPKDVALLSLSEAKGVTLLDQREGGDFEEHADHGGHDHGHAHHGHGKKKTNHVEDAAAKDSHIWLDPENAKAIVVAVTSALSERYPESAEKFNTNAATTLQKLDALRAELTSELLALKGKPFIVFHDATQYFEKSFGLTASGSITLSPDVQPSAKRLTAVRKKIAKLGAVCVFAEPGFQPKLVAAVTEGSQSRSGSLDAEGLMQPPGSNHYYEMMRSLARSIKTCLQPVS
ncbi:MAG: zinc ABC transporter substrate-binding protein [Hyphomicrobium sp.]|nr:MAG: zinc ABC transporter substrate-binding protein [Hyphomicrobium sp.]